MKGLRLLVLAGMLALPAAAATAQIVGPTTGGAAGLAQAARMLGHTKRVLLIGAHPDDENTDLLTYLSRREGAVTGYLSLTRGEGGQNLIGPELGEGLGLIRTGELLAARELDGGRQFFTRAYDFGFSKTLAEALTFWPRDSLRKDVVRIIRRFRPQIVVAMFSGTPRDGHGQHQAAGWAAQEAFRAAGDPAQFPELRTEEGLEPFAPAKLYRSTWNDAEAATLHLDGGVLDGEVGQTIHQIAMRSRSRHRSQDMGSLQTLGPVPINLALVQDRTGAGPAAPLFAGIDTTPPRAGTPEARELEPLAAALAAGRAGLVLDAYSDVGLVAAGDTARVELTAYNAGSASVPVTAGLLPAAGWTVVGSCPEGSLAPGDLLQCSLAAVPSERAAPGVPYFLRDDRIGPWNRWAGPVEAFGEPFGAPPLTARFRVGRSDGSGALATAGADLLRPVVQRLRDQGVGEVRQPLAVVPRISLAFMEPTSIRSVGATDPVTVRVRLDHHGQGSIAGTVQLEVPPGWASPQAAGFRFGGPDERTTLAFEVAVPPGVRAGDFEFRAVARSDDGRRFAAGVDIVTYPHIGRRVYPVSSAMRLRLIDIQFARGRRIGYVRGAADRVPEALAAAGLPVEVLTSSDVERTDLAGFDVMVIGSRAFEADPGLVANNARLLDYVRGGGHLVVQYQQQAYFGGGLAPYSLTLAPRHDRVTDESAAVRILAPDDPLFRSPNPIGPGDWAGWIQERGLYFARSWGREFSPLLEMADPGEQALRGGLLRARLGRGTYTYTGLAFFRQLPAGVPGAFRLFANLLAAEAPPVP